MCPSFGMGLDCRIPLNLFIVLSEARKTSFEIWIAYEQDTPFGYLMVAEIHAKKDCLFAKYLSPESKAISLDLLIGNPLYLGKGLGHQMIRELLLQKYYDKTDVFIDPAENNFKAIHVYAKVGFRKLKSLSPPGTLLNHVY